MDDGREAKGVAGIEGLWGSMRKKLMLRKFSSFTYFVSPHTMRNYPHNFILVVTPLDLTQYDKLAPSYIIKLMKMRQGVQINTEQLGLGKYQAESQGEGHFQNILR